jgi:hypothetical protein
MLLDSCRYSPSLWYLYYCFYYCSALLLMPLYYCRLLLKLLRLLDKAPPALSCPRYTKPPMPQKVLILLALLVQKYKY